VAIPGVYEAIQKRAGEGLKSGTYEMPPPEGQVEKAIREMIAKTRNLDASYPNSLPESEKNDLLAGSVLVSMEDVTGTWLNMGQAVAIFDAPPDRVFRTVADYGTYRAYIPYVVESAVDGQRSKGNVVFLQQRLDFGLILLKDRFYTIQLTQEENPDGKQGTYFIQWTLDPSKPHNVIKNAGSWKLVPYGDHGSKTLVFYTVMADPGGFSPWFWKNLSVKKAVTKVLEAIERRAEIGPAK
jgi:ribosome-associated toxin RatA of RatAB toxin-antitoxin module